MEKSDCREKITATVMAVHRDRYELRTGEETIYARLKTAEFYNKKEIVDFPTVGDVVGVVFNPTGDSLITEIMPRKSVFMRTNSTPGMPDQAVAANFDYVFITMSLNRDFHVSKLERYLTAAWQSGGTPVIILTKADLCEDREEYLAQLTTVAFGVDVYCVSSVTGEGVAELERYLGKDKTSVLLGSSGVGKSSLTNLLLGKEEMMTGEIREADAQGRHTTTYKQCLFLPEEIMLPDGNKIAGGGRIIDTPGMRKLVVTEGEEGVQTSFEDISELAATCRFSDCKHQKEPGCAIREAIADGRLSERRLKSWFSLQREEYHAKARQNALQRRMEKHTREKKESPRQKRFEGG